MKICNKILALTIILASVCACTRVRSKYAAFKERIAETIDDIFSTDFYTSTGGLDYHRVPLIAPYELVSLNKGEMWYCSKRDNINEFGGPVLQTAKYSVEYAGIADSIIYLSYTEATDELNEFYTTDLLKRQYAIIDVSTDSVEWHETKEVWLAALNKRNITSPQLHQVDSLFDDFVKNKRLLFDPKNHCK